MLVFVPPASQCQIETTNAALEVFDRGGGSREAYVYPAAGDYRVFSGTVAGKGGPAPAAPSTSAGAGELHDTSP